MSTSLSRRGARANPSGTAAQSFASSLGSIASRKATPLLPYVLPLAIVFFVACAYVHHVLRSQVSHPPPSNVLQLDNKSNAKPKPTAKGSSHGLPYDVNEILAARAVWERHPSKHTLRSSLWESVQNDVAIAVKTGHEVASERLHKLRTTGWYSVGHPVSNIIIISDEPNKTLGVIGVKEYARHLLRQSPHLSPPEPSAHMSNVDHDVFVAQLNPDKHHFSRGGWRGDKDKNLPGFHLLRTIFPNKKWYVMLDDDTYLFVDNFARYISNKQLDTKPVYTGKVFYMSRCGGFVRDGTWGANHSEPKGVFAHGGGGIFMNSLALDHMYPSVGECIRAYSSCWAGDIQVGLCLRRHGVFVRQLGRHSFDKHFVPFWPSKSLADKRYSSRWKSDLQPLTFHKIPDVEQKLMSEYERECAHNKTPVVYKRLRYHLMSHGVLPLHTARERRNRHFSTEFLPAALKKSK